VGDEEVWARRPAACLGKIPVNSWNTVVRLLVFTVTDSTVHTYIAHKSNIHSDKHSLKIAYFRAHS
jgi:hypothetical protein